MKSKYLHRFQKLDKVLGDSYELRGNLILVEKLPEEERVTKSGLILASESVSARQLDGMQPAKKLLVMRVLYCGKGYYDEDDDTIPLDVKPGNMISAPVTSVQWYSNFEKMIDYEQYTIGRLTEDQIQQVWKDEAAYDTYFDILSGT